MDIYSVTNSANEMLSKYDIDDMLKALGIPDETIDEGADAIEEYAQQNSINLGKLNEMVKETDSDTINGSADKVKEDFNFELEMTGIPSDVIQEGQDTVEAYALKNGIMLPPPPSGINLNIQS